jgi:hypothetical protein
MYIGDFVGENIKLNLENFPSFPQIKHAHFRKARLCKCFGQENKRGLLCMLGYTGVPLLWAKLLNHICRHTKEFFVSF